MAPQVKISFKGQVIIAAFIAAEILETKVKGHVFLPETNPNLPSVRFVEVDKENYAPEGFEVKSTNVPETKNGEMPETKATENGKKELTSKPGKFSPEEKNSEKKE